MIDEIKVYRAYIEAKADPHKTVTGVAKSFNITRSGLYEIVNRIENGNVSKIRTCTENSRLDCLWTYKYKLRFDAIPKDRKESSILALRSLIKDMSIDRFNNSKISSRIGKDRATIIYHLNN